MIVLGVDPGSRTTGWGVIRIEQRQIHIVDYGSINLSPKDAHAIRLKRIYDGLTEVIGKLTPDVCSTEMPVYGQNAQSMLKLGRAQAAVMLAAMNREVPVSVYTPKEIKKSVTGNGNASKKQLWYMLQKMLSVTEDRGLDASDALAAAVCHVHRMKDSPSKSPSRDWASFVAMNPDRIIG